MRAYVLHGIDDLRLEETALPEIKRTGSSGKGYGSRYLRLGYSTDL